MSSGGSFTQTGVSEMRQAVQSLPARVTAALQAVAKASAERIQKDARARLLAQTHGTGRTAELIEIVEDVPNKEYRVISNSRAGTPANDVLWIEYGTRHQAARPYMTPAAKAEEATYRRNVEQAAADVVAQVLA